MRLVKQILICALAALAAGGAQAQSYPTRPVKLVVGFPAGGPADIFGRIFAQGLSERLGQPVIVENRSGQGGVMGIDSVAKAASDGHTLGFNNQGSVAFAPFALSNMPYNPQKDLAMITTVVKVPEVVVVNPSLPVKNLAELVAYAKKNPGKVTFGSAGAGALRTLPASCSRSRRASTSCTCLTKARRPRSTICSAGRCKWGFSTCPWCSRTSSRESSRRSR